MRESIGAAFSFLLMMTAAASADEVALRGYLDVRVVAPAAEKTYLQGGLGKTRFGGTGTSVGFTEAVGEASWWVTPELAAVAVLRVEPLQRTGVDALEVYARYTPRTSGDLDYVPSRPGLSFRPSRWKITIWAGPAPTH